MNEVLRGLFAQRDAKYAELTEFAKTYRGIESPTDEQKADYEARKAVVEQIDARILEVQEEETRNAKIEEARKAAGLLLPGDGVVRSEAGTYGPGSGNSYFADLCWSAMPGDVRYQDACERLNKYGREVVRDAVNDSELRARVVRQAKQHYRGSESRARDFVNQIESRAMDTTSGSGGSFVTPVYLVSEYAQYRRFGRVFIDQANKQELPEYGMTVYLPHVISPSAVASVAEGAAVGETDPTAGYLSAGLGIQAGQVKLSQALLDRAGPGVEFDRVVFDQLQRDYNLTINTWSVTQALANAQAVADASTGSTGPAIIQDFYSDVAQAQQQMETTDGTVLSPTHIFATGTEWSFLSSQTDSTGRPLIVPSAGAPMNAIAAAINGKSEVRTEGATGYEVLDFPVYKDNTIPQVAGTPNQTQIVVAHMPEVWVWEGDLVPRTIPQTYAGNLQVLLQVYTYAAAIVRYPKAVQAIGGARYPAAPTFTRS